MGAGGSLVGIGRFRRAALVADLQQTHDLARLLHLELSDPRQLNAVLGVISQVQLSVFAVCDQKVPDHLVVDLHEGHLDFKFLLRHCAYLVEHALDDEVHDAWLLGSACHSVGLATAGRPIGKNAPVVPLNHRGNETFASVSVDSLSGSSLRKYPIEVVALLFGSVKHLRLLSFTFELQLHFVQHDLWSDGLVSYQQLVLRADDVEVVHLYLLESQRPDADSDKHVRVSVVFIYELLCFLLLLRLLY